MAKALNYLGQMVEVEDDVMGVVNEIHDRWPELRVQYLDPDRFPELTDAPYIIVDTQRDHVVMKVWELNRSVINQLWLMDVQNTNLQALFEVEAAKIAKETAAKKQEETEERQDILLSTFRSPKGSYSFKNEKGEKVVISD